MVIGYFKGVLMYANTNDDKELHRRYEKGMMFASVNPFQTYAVHLRSDAKDGIGGVITLDLFVEDTIHCVLIMVLDI